MNAAECSKKKESCSHAFGKALESSFYERDTRVVAVELIGKVLVFRNREGLLAGRIVETEAYLGGDDPASHAYRGVTPRNRVMFGPPGMSYVYFTYGNHHCFNVVTEPDGKAGAVLIRALEPLEGIEVMKRRRSAEDISNLTSGPGKLTQAFGLAREHSGLDLTQINFHVEDNSSEPGDSIAASPRIGITHAREKMYRYFVASSPFVSVRGKHALR